MILKSKDPRAADVEELNRLLSLDLASRQRSLVEQELKRLQAGERNEEQAAYYLDFHYKDSDNWMVIHDLRIEHRGKVAQIDHLVVNRFLDVYVLESKSFAYGIKITPEGEFLRWDGKTYQAMESPIEQNRRHLFALEQAVTDRKLAPTRLGFPIPVTFLSRVLVSPKSKIIRPDSAAVDVSCVLKADAFFSHSRREVENKSVLNVAKIISQETLREFCERLVRLHRPPGTFDYAAKFGIRPTAVACEPPPAYIATPVPAPQPAPAPEGKPTPAPETTRKSGRVCDACGVEVDAKVAAFCRFNKAKLGGKTLCRDCQGKVGRGTPAGPASTAG